MSMSSRNLGFNTDVSMHKLFYVGYQHILFMVICFLGYGGRASGLRAALHFSCSSHQRALPPGPRQTPKKQRGEGLWEQRPEQAFPTRIRNSFPSLFRVPIPKRWRYNWVHNASLIHLWETAIRLEQERQTVQCQARPFEPHYHYAHVIHTTPPCYFHLGIPFSAAFPPFPALPQYW